MSCSSFGRGGEPVDGKDIIQRRHHLPDLISKLACYTISKHCVKSATNRAVIQHAHATAPAHRRIEILVSARLRALRVDAQKLVWVCGWREAAMAALSEAQYNEELGPVW